jgi:hypothetical protein
MTDPKSTALNGKAERMHRTIHDMARYMVLNSGLTIRLWRDTVKYAAYVLNRSTNRCNPDEKLPLELLEGKEPSSLHFSTSRSLVQRAWSFETQMVKLSRNPPPAELSEDEKGCVVYLKDNKKVIFTRHVKYMETFSSAQKHLTSYLSTKRRRNM